MRFVKYKTLSQLPVGYKKLEYIQSDGDQYIDTGLLSDIAYEFEARFSPNITAQGNVHLFGIYYSSGSRGQAITAAVYTEKRYTGISSGISFQRAIYDTFAGYPRIDHFIMKSGYVAVNDKIISTTAWGILNPSNATVYVFAACNEGQAVNSKFQGRCYDFSIKKNGSYVINLIPCINPQGEVGMYDIVTETFFGNMGTGTFTAGPEIQDNNTMRFATYKNIAILPSAYTRLEYIESTGTQYINTGLIDDPTKYYYVKFSLNNLSTYQTVIGAPYSSTSNRIILNKDNKCMMFQGTNSTLTDTVPITVDTIHIVETRANAFIVDGREQAITSSIFTLRNKNILLFSNYSWNDARGVPQYLMYGKIYEAHISEGTTLVRNFIPAKRNSDNVVGMYDIVTETFFENQGTGSFTAGPEVVDNNITRFIDNKKLALLPAEYKRIEYLQSSGTQYIDTGVNTNSDLGVEFEYSLHDISGYQRFGAFRSVPSYMRHHLDAGAGNGYWFGSDNFFNVARDTNKHQIKIDTKTMTYTFDSSSSVSLPSTPFDLELNYWLFRRNSNSTSYQHYFGGKIYYFKMTDKNNELVRNFIPAKRISDNVVGMYDLVTKQFFTNAGTGSFIPGPEVN